jgi:hypothetical protein
MSDQIYIGDFGKGLKLNRAPFVIDNDSFPFLFNFYAWRGRIKRKRGTSLVGQLQVKVQSVAANPLNYQYGPISLTGGEGNLLVFLGLSPSPNAISGITNANPAVVTINANNFTVGQTVNIVDVQGMFQINNGYYTILSKTTNTITINVDTTSFATYTSGGHAYLAASETIVPGSINLTDGTNTYTEGTPPNGNLIGTPTGVGTINYATGEITTSTGTTLTGTFSYNPALPALGLRDLVLPTIQTTLLFPELLAFDTTYSYQIFSGNFYNVNFYKITGTPFFWSGPDYQLFWTENYQGALWATNNKPGFNFLNGTYVSGTGTENITFNFTSNGVNFTTLLVGDVLFFNEWNTGGSNLNLISATVSSIAGAASGNYVVHFTQNQTVTGTGIVQMLTNTLPGQDGIKWYDGDPTNHTGLPINSANGWVNFAPPLSSLQVAIDDLPQSTYYLVGALAIVAFKDRLLFFSPWIQTSAGGPLQLFDTVIWSWNGTPYYTVSNLATNSSAGTAILVPTNQTADQRAYNVDQTGFGGYLAAGVSQPIKTITNNEDVILVGFGGSGRKTRFVYTGDDIQPFLFYNINSELPSTSTFSAVSLDKGGIDIGNFGICITDQQSSERIDLEIPDTIFDIQNTNNGLLRVNAVRDYLNEWIYFAYPVSNNPWSYPTQTLLLNYRDNTWAVFYENFTCHGYYRHVSKYNWKTIPYPSWQAWRVPWNAGVNYPLTPNVVAGTPQGYILNKGQQGIGEANSCTIQAISNNNGSIQITSNNHCLLSNNPNTSSPAQVQGDYIQLNGLLGMTSLNGVICMVTNVIDANNFVTDLSVLKYPIMPYLGLGKFAKLSQPYLLSKQFNFYWENGRKCRLGVQKYLLDRTANGQVTLEIYLSQDANNPYNNLSNPAVDYSQILYTCPESTNLGLTPFNVNLQTPTASSQDQIWHRMNTSLIGDSVQIGMTLNEDQMKNIAYTQSEITLHGIQLTIQASQILC